jgi:predicted dehydrogenase
MLSCRWFFRGFLCLAGLTAWQKGHLKEEILMKEDRTGMSRRDFAKLSALAGFAIASGNAYAAKKKVSKDVFKVGLIGCGGRGTGAAMDMLTGNDNVQLVALADVFEDRVKGPGGCIEKIKNHKEEKVRSKFAVEDDHIFIGFDAYKKLLETDVDIVLNGALPYCRPEQIEATVEAKKHLFTEKPVAVDPEGIRRVMKAADKAKEYKLSWVAGTQRRHQKDYVETIKKIQDGEIGDVTSMRAYWCGALPFLHERKPEWSDLEYQLRNWYAFCWVAGDNIVEQHVHNLDVCNWVMNGHPKRVMAMGGRTWKDSDPKWGDIWDHFACDYEYDNGVHMMSMSRHWTGCAESVREDVVGTKGISNCKNLCKDAGINPYVQEHIDLVKSITGEGPYLMEGNTVAESTFTAILGRMSAYTGQVMLWDKALQMDLNLVPKELDFKNTYPIGPVPAPGMYKA